MWRRRAAPETAGLSRAGSMLSLAISMALLLLAGCSAFGSSALQFTPAELPVCEGPLITVHIRWDFKAATHQPVRIYVSSPAAAAKLWIVAAPKGEADTGRWMHDGSTIIVRTSRGRLLGIRTLETTPCKKSG